MNLFTKFLQRTSPDPMKQASDASSIELAVTLQQHMKRALTQPELDIVFSLDAEQTEVITNLLKEAKTNGEVQNS